MLPFWPSERLRVSELDGEVLLDGYISSLLDQFWTIMPSITTSVPFLLGYCEIAGILLDQDECVYQILACNSEQEHVQNHVRMESTSVT